MLLLLIVVMARGAAGASHLGPLTTPPSYTVLAPIYFIFFLDNRSLVGYCCPHMDTQSSLAEFRKAVIWKWDYDPDTGMMRNRVSNLPARQACKKGYLKMQVNQRHFFVHRVAFLIMEGRWPEQIDHINRVRDDNRWVNLRESNQIGNAQNHGLRTTNTSGEQGVTFTDRNKWTAEMTRHGLRHRVKNIQTKEEAVAIRKELEAAYERGEWRDYKKPRPGVWMETYPDKRFLARYGMASVGG